MTEQTYRWANAGEWLLWSFQENPNGVSAADLMDFIVKFADFDEIQDHFQIDMDNDGYFDEKRPALPKIKKEASAWDLWFHGVKVTGSYTEGVQYIEEQLTSDEAWELSAFATWLEEKDLNCGHGNYWSRYLQFTEEMDT